VEEGATNYRLFHSDPHLRGLREGRAGCSGFNKTQARRVLADELTPTAQIRRSVMLVGHQCWFPSARATPIRGGSSGTFELRPARASSPLPRAGACCAVGPDHYARLAAVTRLM